MSFTLFAWATGGRVAILMWLLVLRSCSQGSGTDLPTDAAASLDGDVSDDDGGSSNTEDDGGGSVADGGEEEGDGTETDPPGVASVSPADGATGVTATTTVSITFDEAIDMSTVTASTFTLEDSGANPVAGSLDVNSMDAVFTPDAPLEKSETFTARVSTGVTDLAGNPISAEVTWSFTVRPPTWEVAALLEVDDVGDASAPQIAMNASGDGIAVWSQYDGTRFNVWASRYDPNTGWTAPEAVESNSADATVPHVAINAAGNAVVAWLQTDATNDIWANRYTVGVGWGTAELIDDEEVDHANHPRVALDSGNNAIAIWIQRDAEYDNLWAARAPAGGAFGAAEKIEYATGNVVEPRLAIHPDGDAMAVWYQAVGFDDDSIYANRYDLGVGWAGSGTLIENTDESARNPEVAIDSAGNAIVVWQHGDGVRFNIWANRYVVDSVWGSPVLIETEDLGYAEDPEIGLDGSGNAIAVWKQRDGTRYNIWSNRYVSSSGWGAAELVEHADFATTAPQVAVSSTGNAVAVWEQHDGMRYNIWANRYLVGTGWEVTPLLIETTDAGHASTPRVGVDSAGNGVAVWRQANGTRYSIWANQWETD